MTECSRNVFGLDDEGLVFDKACLLVCPLFEPLKLCPTAPLKAQSQRQRLMHPIVCAELNAEIVVVEGGTL